MQSGSPRYDNLSHLHRDHVLARSAGVRLSARINIDNLLDKDYFFTTEPVNGGAELFPGDPITAAGAISLLPVTR